MAAVTTTTTAATYALNIGAVGLVGTFLGMPIEALVLGAISGAIANGLRAPESRVRGVSTIMASTLLSGAFSPAFIGLLAREFSIEAHALQPLVPVVIGAAWPWAVPLLADGAKRIFESLTKRYGRD